MQCKQCWWAQLHWPECTTSKSSCPSLEITDSDTSEECEENSLVMCNHIRTSDGDNCKNSKARHLPCILQNNHHWEEDPTRAHHQHGRGSTHLGYWPPLSEKSSFTAVFGRFWSLGKLFTRVSDSYSDSDAGHSKTSQSSSTVLRSFFLTLRQPGLWSGLPVEWLMSLFYFLNHRMKAEIHVRLGFDQLTAGSG